MSHFFHVRRLAVIACMVAAWLGLAATASAQKRVLYVDYVDPAAHNHPSRVNARVAMSAIAAASGGAFTVTITDSIAGLDAAALAPYDAIVFFTCGDMAPASPLRPALLNFVNSGKGFVGFHSATDTAYSWPEYGVMIGARFINHGSEDQPGTIRVEDPTHVAMQGFANPFSITEEFYLFSNPLEPRQTLTRRDLRVLMSLDPATPTPARPLPLPTYPNVAANDFPLAWTRQQGAGRVFYSALGHRPETWDSAQFRAHALAGIRWALGDGDGDGLADAWEAKWGLSPTSAAGVDGANGDPDVDGQTNAQEQAAGTHPRGASKRYLAEGATSLFFETRIGLANPSPTAVARVQLRYQLDDGSVSAADVFLAPMSQQIAIPPPESLFSTLIDSDIPVVADRTMTWSVAERYGSHAESALTAPAPNWYFAEGSTQGNFDVFFLIQNPSDQTAVVDARFLRPAVGAPITRQYTVTAHRRLTVQADEIPGLGSADLAAEFHSNATPIIVERAMYLSRAGQLWTGGTAGTGATALDTNWFLAEGATGTFFDTFVLVANPDNTRAAQLTVTFLLPAGQLPIVKTYTLPPLGRLSIPVEQVDPALAGTSVSMTVVSTNNVPVVAERTMWWPGSDWYEGHSTLATNTTGTAWAVGDAFSSSTDNSRTYMLVASGASPTNDSLRVSILRDGRPPLVREFADVLRPNARFTLDLSLFPEIVNEHVGVVVESMGRTSGGTVTPMPIVVERAMYSDAGGILWSAGSNLVATKLR